jgi:hypothetical protein
MQGAGNGTALSEAALAAGVGDLGTCALCWLCPCFPPMFPKNPDAPGSFHVVQLVPICAPVQKLPVLGRAGGAALGRASMVGGWVAACDGLAMCGIHPSLCNLQPMQIWTHACVASTACVASGCTC